MSFLLFRSCTWEWPCRGRQRSCADWRRYQVQLTAIPWDRKIGHGPEGKAGISRKTEFKEFRHPELVEGSAPRNRPHSQGQRVPLQSKAGPVQQLVDRRRYCHRSLHLTSFAIYKGYQNGLLRPLPGSEPEENYSGDVARCGLNHRLRSFKASGLSISERRTPDRTCLWFPAY